MSNPATELAQILESWEVPRGQSAYNARAVEGEDNVAFWTRQAQAVTLLRAVIAEIDAMQAAGDDVSAYSAYIATWSEGIFCFHNGWQSGHSQGGTAVEMPSLLALKSLGLLLSKTGRAVGSSPTQRATLLACLAEALQLIESELDDWDRSEKEYLYRLVASARGALEEHPLLGEIDIRKLLNELIGALTGVALDLRASEGKTDRFDRIMNWVASTAGVVRGIVYDAEALASLGVAVGTIAAVTGSQ
ncbi:hypothetical protein [Agromyces humatus]|uniref:Uncharacterized protein n=1 Tax=Agromyces humatus TaxID=279573 RepID=A0ABN2KX11_9MICO|nr:hypothetical protein [Agromyces humatus]